MVGTLRFSGILVLWITALGLATSSFVSADWTQSADPLLVHPSPANGARLKQNPPRFAWAPAKGVQDYQVSLVGPTKAERRWQPRRNLFLPEERLQPGEYVWKVRPNTAGGMWSAERRFVVPPDAGLFEVPGDEQILKSIRARARPRALPTVTEGVAAWAATLRREKQAAVTLLEQQVRAYATQPHADERALMLVPRSQSESAWVQSLTTIRQRTQSESRQIRAAALLWKITNDRFYRDEAVRRADALAALDFKGSTSHVNQDQGNRAIAFALAIAYDLLSPDLDAERTAKWLDSITRRTGAIHADLQAGGWRLEAAPLDSHGATNFGYLATLSALMIDAIPQADPWFRDSFRAYINYESPWGEDEGGFANGSAYAEYATDTFVTLWDPIFTVTGVNLYVKPWSKGFLRFLACFVPPGTPVHVFGDAAETKPSVNLLKAFSNRIADGAGRWYSRNLTGQEDALTDLLNPLARQVAQVAAIAPESRDCTFSDVGWVAMHSDLQNRGRTSLYFKSSRYGSFNHSHADQNSFTLVSGGRPLLIDSGWYDWYGSPVWKDWYRQTRAHNAVTFDGGQGQVADGSAASTLNAGGSIGVVSRTDAVDFAEGDSTRSYGGAVNSARRRIWYLRGEDAVVIWDKLESTVPRVFEWNFHAAVPIAAEADGKVTIRNHDQSVCITPLLREGLEFHNRTGAPEKSGTAEGHAFYSSRAAVSAEFLFLLDIGCKNLVVALRATASGRELKVRNEQIRIQH